MYDLALAVLNLFPDAISQFGLIGCGVAALYAVGLPTVLALGIWASLD